MKTFKVTFGYGNRKDEFEIRSNGVDGALSTATKKFEAKHKNEDIKDPKISITRVNKDFDD